MTDDSTVSNNLQVEIVKLRERFKALESDTDTKIEMAEKGQAARNTLMNRLFFAVIALLVGNAAYIFLTSAGMVDAAEDAAEQHVIAAAAAIEANLKARHDAADAKSKASRDIFLGKHESLADKVDGIGSGMSSLQAGQQQMYSLIIYAVSGQKAPPPSPSVSTIIGDSLTVSSGALSDDDPVFEEEEEEGSAPPSPVVSHEAVGEGGPLMVPEQYIVE